MPPIGYVTRCYICAARLTTVDAWNSDPKSEARPYDPDWVIAEHIRRTHS